jgi:hypothetical protein
MIGPGLVEVLTQVPEEPHHLAIGASISLLVDLALGLLRLSTPCIPPANEVGVVGLEDGSMRGSGRPSVDSS